MKSILRPSSYTNWSYATSRNISSSKQQRQQQRHDVDNYQQDDDDKDNLDSNYDDHLMISKLAIKGDEDIVDGDGDDDYNNDDDSSDTTKERPPKVVTFTSPLVVVDAATMKSTTTILIDGIAYDPTNSDLSTTKKYLSAISVYDLLCNNS